MSRLHVSAALASMLSLLPLAVVAQQKEEEPEPAVVYSTYFECAVADQWQADAVVDQVWTPVYDAAVADGTISAWGWMRHHLGGPWRRALYLVAPGFDAALDASDAIGAKLDAADPKASALFDRICGTHDDYLWSPVAGPGPGNLGVATAPAKAAVSVYMVCDMARQERADEIMKAFAPVYDAQIAAGKLTGWGWLEHVVGGKYRRLLTMRGPDHKSVGAAWGAIIEELAKTHPAEDKELDGICNSHQDYLWDVGR